VIVSDTPPTSGPTGIEYWNAHTDQIIVTRNEKLLAAESVRAAAQPLKPLPGFRVWTDDFYNLLDVLKP
jgi:hypothetical protein